MSRGPPSQSLVSGCLICLLVFLQVCAAATRSSFIVYRISHLVSRISRREADQQTADGDVNWGRGLGLVVAVCSFGRAPLT